MTERTRAVLTVVMLVLAALVIFGCSFSASHSFDGNLMQGGRRNR